MTTRQKLGRLLRTPIYRALCALVLVALALLGYPWPWYLVSVFAWHAWVRRWADRLRAYRGGKHDAYAAMTMREARLRAKIVTVMDTTGEL